MKYTSYMLEIRLNETKSPKSDPCGLDSDVTSSVCHIRLKEHPGIDIEEEARIRKHGRGRSTWRNVRAETYVWLTYGPDMHSGLQPLSGCFPALNQ